MTISHPAKVKLSILSSGIDTLVLAVYVNWSEAELFSYLDGLKQHAQTAKSDYPGEIKFSENGVSWPFNVKPHGAKGFSWILTGADFTFKVGDWQETLTRPSVMVEIRSETLWRLGTEDAVNIVLNIIKANKGQIVEVKLSRVDLCMDVLMPESVWSFDLMKYAVTRAIDTAPYYRFQNLTGIRIGKGLMSARLYDKPLEIKQQSGKRWMFDIWGIEDVPDGQKIIRIEFQMRRGVLKEIKLNTIEDLYDKLKGAWAYCTQKWLKFQDRPGLHHTQRSTFEWWETIQSGFVGIQDAKPLIREKALCADKRRLVRQAKGLLIALHAIKQEERGAEINENVKISDCVRSYMEELMHQHDELPDIHCRVLKHRAKHHRHMSDNLNTGQVYKLRKQDNLT